MTKWRIISAGIFIVIAGGALSSTDADPQSDNYNITSSEISGGGSSVGTSSFRLNGTIGQPTPLMPETPPLSSANYKFYPGFWYTHASLIPCAGDTEPDGDVDGLDLAIYAGELAGGTATFSIHDFVAGFGRTDCQ